MNIWIIKIIIIIELKFKRVINKCPAIKFAVNRIAKDKGRIIILIDSIIAIKGARKIGVFKGIKWVIKFLKFLIIDIKIKKIQNGKANDNEKIMWLEVEKIYGKSPKKLLKKININNVININDGDLIFLILNNIKISLLRLLNNFNIIILIRLGISHKKFGIIIIIKILAIQFKFKLKIIVDGSKILNKFIII